MLPERYRKAVIAVNGDVAATILGVVAGTWAVERKRREAILRLVRFVEPDARVHGVR